jgi:hypothetical protein
MFITIVNYIPNIVKKIIFFSALTWLIAGPLFAFTSIRPDTGKIILDFKNVVNGLPLTLNDSVARYRNANGDSFSITTFKYYVSNIILTNTKGRSVAIPDTYFLINAADTASLKQTVKGVPAGNYRSITFTIGVDSARNFDGVQSGCLDPANGMFWTWNSGYIFLKLEGYSPQSAAKMHKLTFHVGGIKRQNTLRSFSHSFVKPLNIKGNMAAYLSITTDAGALFKGNTVIEFAKLSYTMGGPNAVLLADNYTQGLFSVMISNNLK